jgi:hypothetical protein
MKNLIKQIIKESIDDLSQEELNKINNITNERYQEYQNEITKLKNDIKHWQSTITNINNTDKLSDSEKELLLKELNYRLKNLNTQLNSYQTHTRDVIYKDVYNNFLSNKKYQQALELHRKNKTFSNEDIEDLFVSALEGGSNYWYRIKYIPKEIRYHVKELKQPLAEAIANHVINGGYIQFFDAENKDELLGTVDMDKLLDAISLLKKDYPDTWNNIIDENADANDADIFLQLAVMGDVVFG